MRSWKIEPAYSNWSALGPDSGNRALILWLCWQWLTRGGGWKSSVLADVFQVVTEGRKEGRKQREERGRKVKRKIAGYHFSVADKCLAPVKSRYDRVYDGTFSECKKRAQKHEESKNEKKKDKKRSEVQ
ncbi:hypothetical protein QLX08_010488 [Tetragonisca angustula]|uniref:Uncharacterized protein n=1 Tax=Tetragonisca angustula TaxID=166442 RepID=A0AAW0ZC08_9HYME